MNLDKILTPVVTAAVIAIAAFSWRTELRLQRIEYALGIEDVLPKTAKGKHHAQVVERAAQ